MMDNLTKEVLKNNSALKKIHDKIEKVENWDKLPQKPMVTISMATYNHENFIIKSIEGVLMQQTNFDFEIIIKEDFSNDRTREIVVEYQKKYPHIIRLWLCKENLYSQKLKPRLDAFARGRYIAKCEGDDYWTDPFKLQKQVDFLEANPEYSLVCGGFISKNDETGEEKVELKEVEASPDHTEKGFDITLERLLKQWLTKTLTLMYRKSALDLKEYQKYKYAKDFHLNYELLKKGKGYYMKEIFGVYHVHDGGVFSKLTQEMRHSIHFQMYGEVHRKNPSDELIKKKYYNVLRKIIKNEYSIKTPFRIYFEMYKISGSRKDFKKMVKAALGRK